jgi:phosphatidylglycerol:prolipoprotein diacylglycerol transferase
MYPIFFRIGPISIYTYGVLVFFGVILGYWVSLRQAEREGIDKNTFTNITFWTLFFSFIGARVFYIVVEFRSFLEEPLAVVFSRSGFVFYGGVIFGFVFLYIFAKKYRISFLKLADTLALGIPLGHSLGRVGCFSYGCCYGRPTSSFMGILFPPDSPAGYLGVKVIPTQLLESFFLFVIFIILLFLKKKKKFNGQLFLCYIFLYSILRFIVEFFRGDPRGEILFLSTSQFISFILILLSIFLWLRLRKPLA